MASGLRFDGCRLPPGTWTLLRRWVDEGLQPSDAVKPEVLQAYAGRARRSDATLRAPQASKFADMLSFLEQRRVLTAIVNRQRDPAAPGIPDLFLYRVGRDGRVHGGRFVEVKRWSRADRAREQVSSEQKAELAFLRGLGLAAQVVYLIER